MNEKGEAFDVPHSRTLQHVWQGIIEGKFSPQPDEDIDRLIEEEYFQYTPLIPITSTEEKVVRNKLREHLRHALNKEKYRELAEQNIVRPKEGKMVFWNRTQPGSPPWEGQTLEWQTVTRQEKIQLLQDPDVVETIRYTSGSCTSGLKGWGNRRLDEPDYYLFQKEKFPSVVKRIRDRTRREKL